MAGTQAPRPMQALKPGDELPSRTVTAHNNSLNSANKIHDDEVAKKYGFAGGLVPGVTVYAYMCSPLALAQGEHWLANGEATVSLISPLYENAQATSHAVVTAAGDDRGIDFDLWTQDSTGRRCGVGTATVLPPGSADAVVLPDYVASGEDVTHERMALTLENAPVGRGLTPLLLATSIDDARGYADIVEDENPLFRDASIWGPPLIHPGWLLSNCNTIFTQDFEFGPWIHTRSTIRYLGPALAGSTLTLRGRLAEVYERRQHHYAVLDLFCTDEERGPVMAVQHTAIFQVHSKA